MSFGEERSSGLGGVFSRETLISIVAFFLCWELLSLASPYLGIPPFAVPSLFRIGQSFTKITAIDILVTLARVIAALMVSFALGVAVAIAMYLSGAVERYLYPMVRILMAVPVVSWILFAILWFRGVEFRILFVLVVVCAPVFVVDTLDSMRSVPRELRDMMRSFRPTSFQFFRKLMLPAILPGIFTSWKITLSLAIRVVSFNLQGSDMRIEQDPRYQLWNDGTGWWDTHSDTNQDWPYFPSQQVYFQATSSRQYIIWVWGYTHADDHGDDFAGSGSWSYGWVEPIVVFAVIQEYA